jgi:hypothetical protein
MSSGLKSKTDNQIEDAETIPGEAFHRDTGTGSSRIES